MYGTPNHIRSDNGPEFIAKAIRGWVSQVDIVTLYDEPGSPWENGYVVSFHSVSVQRPDRFFLNAGLACG